MYQSTGGTVSDAFSAHSLYHCLCFWQGQLERKKKQFLITAEDWSKTWSNGVFEVPFRIFVLHRPLLDKIPTGTRKHSFALNKLLLWLFSFHNSYSLPSSLLLFWCSLVYFLQWMATRGLRWSPCTPHWSSALRAHRLRWAQPWRRPWVPLKTLCSHLSPKSRTESPDQARSQPGIFLFSFFGLLSKWRNPEGVFSTWLMHFTSARMWTLRWH